MLDDVIFRIPGIQLLFLLFESKNSFLFLPKAVKSCKNSTFWPIYCPMKNLQLFCLF